MIISHKYKFIFIKTLKTAGTSIEVDLNKVLGETDIVTEIYPPEEGCIPKNYMGYMSHMSAMRVKERVDPVVWNEYFKFCVEREPVDKVISHYCMLKNSPFLSQYWRNLTFDGYMAKREFPVDTFRYTDENGELIVDKILKYEDLENEFEDVTRELGLNLKLTSRAKSGYRKDLKITEEQAEIIYKEFSSSNKYTGYELTKFFKGDNND